MAIDSALEFFSRTGTLPPLIIGKSPIDFHPKIAAPPVSEKYPFENLYPIVKNYWEDPVTQRDIIAIESFYFTSQVPTCVAFSTYFAINRLMGGIQRLVDKK